MEKQNVLSLYDRFIRGTTTALRFCLLANGTTPLFIYKL